MPRMTRCTVRPWLPNDVSTKPDAEMPGILADDPAVVQPDVAARGESGDGFDRAVFQDVVAVHASSPCR